MGDPQTIELWMSVELSPLWGFKSLLISVANIALPGFWLKTRDFFGDPLGIAWDAMNPQAETIDCGPSGRTDVTGTIRPWEALKALYSVPFTRTML